MGAPHPWDPFPHPVSAPQGSRPTAGCSTARKSSQDWGKTTWILPGAILQQDCCHAGMADSGNGQDPARFHGDSRPRGAPVPTGRAARSSVSADIWGWEPPVTCHSSASPGQVARMALILGTAGIPPDKPSDPRLSGSRRRLRGLRRAGDTCGSSPRGDETWSVSGWWE